LRPELLDRDEKPKSKMGLFIGLGVAAAAVIGIVAVVLSGGKDPEAEKSPTQPEVTVAASDTAKLEATVGEAQALLESGDFNGAEAKLDTVRGQLSGAPSLAGTVDRLDKQIEVGRRLASARQLDADGKVEAALSAYQAVLEVDASNAEARTRIAELGKGTNTPPPPPESGSESSADKKKKKVVPKAQPVVTPQPEPKPEPTKTDDKKKDNPFLPTKKKNDGGTFLPTEK
jgi:hypothetical protein